MTKTIIPPEPQPGDDQPNRWFKAGQLTDIEPAGPVVQLPFEPRLVVDPKAPPLPKREAKRQVSSGRHCNGMSVHELLAAHNVAVVSAVATAFAVSDAPGRADRAELAAKRAARGYLSAEERLAYAGIVKAYAEVPAETVLPLALLATLEAAVTLLSASRADQQAGADTDIPTTSAAQDGTQ